MNINKIVAYTDGSASWRDPKLGGYGVYIIDGDQEFCFHEGFKNTKVGRVELRGIITCLQKITDKDREIEIYCDSEYVTKCITNRRLWKWKRKCWVGIKNTDLVIQFYEEYSKFKIPPKVIHVKGHTKNDDIHSLGNAIADHLANYRQFEEYKQDLL